MRPDAPPSVSPYRALLGDDYDTLHPNVRAAHEAPLVAEGVFDVVHGSHLVVPVLIWIMKLPASGRSVPVHLQVVDEAAAPGARSLGMRWSRRIGRSILETHQFAQDDFLVEQSGAGSVVFVLHPAELAWPEDEVIGAERVHRIFCGWLAELGHPGYAIEVASPGESTRTST